jgi:hypothetical protein
MNQRGRKGSNVVPLPGCEASAAPGHLPEPPADLTKAEREVWRTVVATKPAEWFSADIHPLLADYCTACVQQAAARKVLNSCKKAGVLEKAAAVKAFDLLAKLKLSLATKMRLTQQSRYTPQASATAARRAAGARPWEQQ